MIPFFKSALSPSTPSAPVLGMFCISDHSELYIIYVARGKGQVLDFASSKFVFKRQIKKEHFKYKRLRPVTLAVGGIREVREDRGEGGFGGQATPEGSAPRLPPLACVSPDVAGSGVAVPDVGRDLPCLPPRASFLKRTNPAGVSRDGGGEERGRAAGGRCGA